LFTLLNASFRFQKFLLRKYNKQDKSNQIYLCPRRAVSKSKDKRAGQGAGDDPGETEADVGMGESGVVELLVGVQGRLVWKGKGLYVWGQPVEI
jgi:hypothetical protein